MRAPSITPLSDTWGLAGCQKWRESRPRAYGVRDAPGPRGHVARLPRSTRSSTRWRGLPSSRPPTGTCSGSSSARRASPASPRPRRSVTRSTPSRGASGRCRSTRSWGTRTAWAPTWWCARRSASSWATSSTRAPAGQPGLGFRVAGTSRTFRVEDAGSLLLEHIRGVLQEEHPEGVFLELGGIHLAAQDVRGTEQVPFELWQRQAGHSHEPTSFVSRPARRTEASRAVIGTARSGHAPLPRSPVTGTPDRRRESAP